MSELINNSKQRQNELKQLIRDIHNGLSLAEAKKRFATEFGSITTEEIVALEQSLIQDGMKISEVQRLCDVHAAVFDGSIEDIHKQQELTEIPGHPANVFHMENARILRLIEEEIIPYMNESNHMNQLMLRVGIERLSQVSKHYERKEYLFFPGLERKGISSIPQVMWGVDNEIREMLKNILEELSLESLDLNTIFPSIHQTLEKIQDMVTKEDHILLPKLTETLEYNDWVKADLGSDEIGYFLERPKDSWVEKKTASNPAKPQPEKSDSEVNFDAGSLNPLELNWILNTLPLDMTFVDKDGHVKYFTQGKERIFQRPITIIGRHVSMCHPPKSVHIVEEIVESFRSGRKDVEDFYIHMGKVYAYIRYFAIRDQHGNYLGTLEITQDIAPIQALSGEKRLVSE
ncbi:MAG: DUF438 domain-containing protein [Bacilli bacterium]|nr:DUF438 domain-containing protein [Bacilli bacterium]MBN2877700.1 DUF438 domain-containing protein [Bacilli bacterium]